MRCSKYMLSGTSRAVPCHDLVDPCRAKYFRAVPWWIRAVPNISVPCPHDPCPDLVDPCQKIWGPFLPKKKAPAATYPQVKGFQKYGALFCRKKGACGNVPTSQGLPEIWGPFLPKKKRLRQRTHKLRASRNLAPLGFRPKNKVFERPGL